MSLLYAWILAMVVAPSMAQTSKLFQWGFANTALSTSLPTCVTLPIVVKSFNPITNDTHGTPPYYMMAFAVGGTPVTTFIGTDENNLSWTVTQPVGSQLVLSVVDANGSAGGIPPRILNVIAGSTTQCVNTPISTPEFKVTANITGDLQTCQPWGFTVKGGVPPYTITLAAPNSPVVTNVTIPFGDDAFTYINRADPSGQLIGAISDLTGRWATGTPIVNTRGSSDTSCVGLVSSSGNATLIQQEINAEDSAATSGARHRRVVTGVSVTLVLLLFIGLGAAAFFYQRRREQRNHDAMIKAFPTQFVEVKPQNLSMNADLESSTDRLIPSNPTESTLSISPPAIAAATPTMSFRENYSTFFPSPRSPSNPSSPGVKSPSTVGLTYHPSSNQSAGNPSPSDSIMTPNINIQPQTAAGRGRAGFNKFPTSSIRASRSAKANQAGVQVIYSPDSEYPPSAISDASNVLGRQMSNATVAAARRAAGPPVDRVVEEGENPQAFEHRDAESGAPEPPPPPYVDRSAPVGPEPPHES